MHIFTTRTSKKIVGLGAEAHLNTCFKHFIYFVHEFKLIDPKELQPLKDLIDSLMGRDKKGADGKSEEGGGEDATGGGEDAGGDDGGGDDGGDDGGGEEGGGNGGGQ
jgi:hypothetical protein